jgi:adiponectin receptor
MSAKQRKSKATAAILENATHLEEQVASALTVSWNDLPLWQQDNHFIHSGYRPASFSFKKSLESLGYLHNESINIYSHLVGAIAFSLTGSFLYSSVGSRYKTATDADIRAFGCFFVGAVLCLGMSGTYHTISNHSPNVQKFGNKLDYVGIVFLITGSFIPSIYYGFYCHQHLQEFYWIMV